MISSFVLMSFSYPYLSPYLCLAPLWDITLYVWFIVGLGYMVIRLGG
jgi:hypothetical protein